MVDLTNLGWYPWQHRMTLLTKLRDLNWDRLRSDQPGLTVILLLVLIRIFFTTF